MKILNTPHDVVQWLRQHVHGSLTVDSRQVQPGDGFIAWPGAAVDGRQFVADLLQKQHVGACLVEAQDAEKWSWIDAPRVAAYSGLKVAISAIAAQYYKNPSHQLDVLAVTGTNGKTSTSWWLAQALTFLNHTCGVIGTLGVGTFDQLAPSALTTPDPVRLHEVMRDLVNRQVKACAVEASSIGLAEHRFDDVRVKVALLTNVTQDHLDYHGNMQAYWEAKKRLFSWVGLQAAVVNVDDPLGAELAHELLAKNKGLRVYTYSRQENQADSHEQATLKAKHIEHTAAGIAFDLVEGTDCVRVHTVLIGDYNISNILAVAGALRALGYSLQDVANACSALVPVPGRMQNVFALHGRGCPQVVVDYAHTPDALLNVLQALKPLARATEGRLWCVFGCGGNRDAGKRPLMGQVVQQEADGIVVTSDNPRGEDPAKIVEQIIAGMDQSKISHVDVNRQKALAWAIAHADEKDIVLVAGKGHESYQEVGSVRYPFSDIDCATQLLNARGLHKAGRKEYMNEYMMTLQQAKDLLQSQGIAARLVGNPEIAFSRVHTDTRSLQGGDLFVALHGERFDAHEFLPQASAQGAVAVIAEHGIEQAGCAGLEVADTLKALGALARGWRSCWQIPVIAVTGSNGKTTTTQMISSILKAQFGDAALATQGNLNNAIGVPLMVLRLRAHHQVAVFELGMNHPGEITYLAKMVNPTVALVNNAQREHLEFMHSIQAVAQENGQVIEALPHNGVAVFPADDAYTPLWKEMAQKRCTATFALNGAAFHADYGVDANWDTNAWVLKVATPQGALECRLHCAGQHNVKNALAAVVCAMNVGVSLTDIAQGLNAFAPVSGRSQAQVLQLDGRQVILINDAYNANPDSVHAAIDVLAELPQPALLVLGEMGEVGEQGDFFHQEAGEYALQKGVSALWGAGKLVKHAVQAFGEGANVNNARYFDDVEVLAQTLAEQKVPFASVLVKGSRFMRMERVVERLHTLAETTSQGDAHVA